ncbi:MAG: hypothetical protein QXO33_03450 [Nitrososphaeria archaeon]
MNWLAKLVKRADEEKTTPPQNLEEKPVVQQDKDIKPDLSNRALQKAKELGIPEELITKEPPKVEIEVGVPYVPDQSSLKIYIDRRKPPRYNPLGIILPADETKGKVVDLKSKKVIEGEGNVSEEFYSDAESIIKDIESLMDEINKLEDHLSKFREEYQRYVAPLQAEISQKDSYLNSKILDLFWLMYNAGVKGIKVGDILYTLKAQLERTGKFQKDKIEEFIHLISKILYKAYGFQLNVRETLQSLMGSKLVVELNRIGDIIPSQQPPTSQETPSPSSPEMPSTPNMPNISPKTSAYEVNLSKIGSVNDRLRELNEYGDLLIISLEKIISILEDKYHA